MGGLTRALLFEVCIGPPDFWKFLADKRHWWNPLRPDCDDYGHGHGSHRRPLQRNPEADGRGPKGSSGLSVRPCGLKVARVKAEKAFLPKVGKHSITRL